MNAEEQLDKIREILEQPWTSDYQVLRIRMLLTAQPDPRPIATDDKGWPMLNEDGTAWERHDDPEADR